MTFTCRSLALATALCALAFPAAAQTSWDMPTPYGDTVFHTKNILEFADDVREATGGQLNITVHSAGSLYGHPEIKDSVRRGLAPIGEILLSRLANENPLFEADSIPFLADSYADARALWTASRPAIEALMAEQGLTLLYAVPWPGQSLYLTEEVTDPAALRGVTFRAYNTATEQLANILGMVPTQVEAGDIPTAFATGRVAAMMTSPSTGVSSQAWDYTSVYIDVNAWLPKNVVFVNTEALNALPEDQRTALLAAAAEAETRGWAMSEAETATQIATLQGNGMTVIQPTAALSEALAAAGEQMTSAWLARAGDAGAAVVAAFEAAK